MPRDDEKGVVDAYAEADHCGERRRDRRHLGRVPEQPNDGERAHEAEYRRHDGEAHRRGSAEREQEDDHRGGQADCLADLGARLRDLLSQVASRCDLQPGIPRRVRGVDNGLGLVLVEVGGPHVQRHRDEPDRLVLAERGRALFAERANDPDDVRRLLERLDRRLNRLLVLRARELAVGRLENDGVAAVRLIRQPLLEQIQRTCRARAGEGEVVAGRPPDDPPDQREHDHEHDPCGNYRVVVPDAKPPDAVEQSSHTSRGSRGLRLEANALRGEAQTRRRRSALSPRGLLVVPVACRRRRKGPSGCARASRPRAQRDKRERFSPW